MGPREAMIAALREMVTAELRPVGFTGSVPHLRRRGSEQICLITFQFFSSGGSFVAEVAECPAEGFTTSSGRLVEPGKVTAQDGMHPRPRLGSATFPDGDHWFGFGPRSFEPGSAVVQPPEHYRAVAADVARAIREQAEPFWAEQLALRSA